MPDKILQCYRSFIRRLRHSPLDPLSYRFLLKTLRRRFRKRLPQQSSQILLQHKLSQAEAYYLPLARKAFVHSDNNSIHALLDIAFKSSDTNTGHYYSKYPQWFATFNSMSNDALIAQWPVTRLKKQGNKLKAVQEQFKDGIQGSKNRFGAEAPKLSDGGDEVAGLIAKVEAGYRMLKSERLQMKRSLPEFRPLIPLHLMGVPLAYERQKNIVDEAIRSVKHLFSSTSPLNPKVYRYLTNFIEKGSVSSYGKLKGIHQMLQNSIARGNKRVKSRYDDRVLDYKVHYNFNSKENVYLRKVYIEYLAKQYVVDDHGLFYCDNLADVPFIRDWDQFSK